MNKNLKPSTARLFAMLPSTLVIRCHVAHGKPARVEVLDGQGGPTELDANYPGFQANLALLVTRGLVVHMGGALSGKPGSGKGYVDQVFAVLRAKAAA